MLNRVRHHWIDDVLEGPLENRPHIALLLARWPEAVSQRRMKLRRPNEEKVLPEGTPVSKAFNDVGGKLLILAPPGSGKTTALLELARDLLNHADQNPAQPMPVVFNLSSWAQHQPQFADWLIEELHHSYEVPQRIATCWVEDGVILPLLDGMDEVTELHHRAGCVEAINEFRRTKYFGNLVVCSRAEYQNLNARLELGGAVELQPLTPDQIDRYLETIGTPLAHVRAALKANENQSLWELVESPLMLSIVTLVYRNRGADTLRALGLYEKPEEQQEKLLEKYVEWIFERRPMRRYRQDQAREWLSWLAFSMREHKQSEFDLDRLQPEWLPRMARPLVTLIPALLSGVIGGIAAGLVAWLAPRLATSLVAWLASVLSAKLAAGPVVGPAVGLNDALRAGLGGGLVFALVALGGGLADEPVPRLRWPWLGLGLGFGLAALLILGPMIGLAAGLATMVVGRAYDLVRGDGMTDAQATIDPVEQLRWSRSRLRDGLVVGVRGGLRVGWRIGRLFGPASGLAAALRSRGFGLSGGPALGPGLALKGGLVTGVGVTVLAMLSVGFVNGLVNGLVSGRVAGLTRKKVVPNQGIRRSARHGLWVGLGAWLVTLLVSVLISMLFWGPRGGLGTGLGDQVGGGLLGGLGTGLRVGLSGGLVFALVLGLVFGLLFGGLACLRHLALRGLLVWYGYTPWRYIRFLHATELLFLRRSGGSYVFVHRILFEHFAELKPMRPSS